jgi:hypothetical protein
MSTPTMPPVASDLHSLRRDLSDRTGRGINAIVAGVGLWTVFTILGFFLTDDFALALAYVLGSGLLFPLSLLTAKVMGLDPYAEGNALGTLAGLLGGVQILFIPLMVGATFVVPEMVPWFLAVLVGAHLLPFTWVYNSRTYLLTSITIPAAAGLTGWLLPAHTAIAAPAVVVVVLLIAAVRLAGENAAARDAR